MRLDPHLVAALIFALVFAICAAVGAGEAYVRPGYPPQARSLSPEQIDRIVDAAPPGSTVAVPASYAKQLPGRRAVATNQLARAAIEYLGPVIEDSRACIPGLSGLSDAEVALLYLAQMKKDAGALLAQAPTNTLEYLVGCGMRRDLAALTNASPAISANIPQAIR